MFACVNAPIGKVIGPCVLTTTFSWGPTDTSERGGIWTRSSDLLVRYQSNEPKTENEICTVRFHFRAIDGIDVSRIRYIRVHWLH